MTSVLGKCAFNPVVYSIQFGVQKTFSKIMPKKIVKIQNLLNSMKKQPKKRFPLTVDFLSMSKLIQVTTWLRRWSYWKHNTRSAVQFSELVFKNFLYRIEYRQQTILKYIDNNTCLLSQLLCMGRDTAILKSHKTPMLLSLFQVIELLSTTALVRTRDP